MCDHILGLSQEDNGFDDYGNVIYDTIMIRQSCPLREYFDRIFFEFKFCPDCGRDISNMISARIEESNEDERKKNIIRDREREKK